MAVTLAERLRDFIGSAEKPKMTQGDLVSGVFRMGSLGSFSGQAWYYSRIVSAVYHNPTGKRCTDAISAAFARAPLKCYKPGDEIRETPVESPLQALLNNPVPQGLSVPAVSGKASARKRARDLTLAGMSLTLKVRGDSLEGGPITQLRRLAPQRVTVVGNHHDELLGFVYNDRIGGRLPLLPQWVVYERFSHPDRDFQAFPPALAAGLAAETDNKAARFNLDLLENDGAVPAVVMLEGLTPAQFGEWVATWESHEYPGKTRFMGFKGTPTGGKSVEVVPLGQSNKDMMHDKIRDYSQEDVARALGCPPVVTFNMAHETYANADREIKLWYATTIWDYWDQSADESTAQLGAEFGVELGYDYSRIPELQESTDSMVDRLLKLQENQNLAINETNRRLGYPEVDWGDEPIQPVLKMQGQPGPPAGEPPPAPPGPPKLPGSPPPTPPPVAALTPYRRQGRASLTVVSLPSRETSAPTTADHGAALARAQARTERRLQRFFTHQGRVLSKRLLTPGRDRSASALVRRGYFDTERWDEELREDAASFLGDGAEDLGIAIDVDGRSAELAQRVNAETQTDLEALTDAAVTAGQPIDAIAGAVIAYFDSRGAERARELARLEVEALVGEVAA